GMQGMMAGGPGMYPAGGFVNLDVDMDPGFVSLDLEGPRPCSPCGTPMMHHHEHHCPMPTPCPTPCPTPAHEVYVVKKGDTVWKIAQRYGTTMQAIILANNLRNPDLIYPGQVLFIPGASTGKFYG
ncbi:MAG: LysM protein,collagen triple helix repeat protein, partial [Firmicutes bacterium]|nr:LysM protein,collagen triple helix repeat protein [Bacillota bacterium]